MVEESLFTGISGWETALFFFISRISFLVQESIEKGLSPFLKKMGMEDAEDGEGRIEDDSDLKQIEESLRLLKLTEETEDSIKSKENRHESSRIFSDHPDFVILPVEIPDTHIIQSPEGGQKKRDHDCDSCDDEESPKLKLPFGNEQGG